MRVHIEDDLYIESDAHCYMLVQSKVVQEGRCPDHTPLQIRYRRKR